MNGVPLFLADEAPDVPRMLRDDDLPLAIRQVTRLCSDALQDHGVFDLALYRRSEDSSSLRRWCSENRANFLWLVELLIWLMDESDRRFGVVGRGGVRWRRQRKIAQVCVEMAVWIPAGEMTAPPQVMPPDFRGPNTVEAHRAYYEAMQ